MTEKELLEKAKWELVRQNIENKQWSDAILCSLTGIHSQGTMSPSLIRVVSLCLNLKLYGATLEDILPAVERLKNLGLLKIEKESVREGHQVESCLKQFISLNQDGLVLGFDAIRGYSQGIKALMAEDAEKESQLVAQYEETTHEWMKRSMEHKKQEMGLSTRMHTF